MAPGILDIHGVGPVSAVTFVAAYSRHGLVRSEGAFAASPAPAQPGIFR